MRSLTRERRASPTDAFPGDSKGHLMPRFASITLVLLEIFRKTVPTPSMLWREPRLSRFGANAIRPGPYRGTGRRGGRRKGRYRACSVCRGGAAPRKNAHRFAVFRDRAAGNINAGFAQSFHDGIVGEDRSWRLRIDQLLDVVADRLRRMRLAAVGRRNRGGENISARSCRDWSPYICWR